MANYYTIQVGPGVAEWSRWYRNDGHASRAAERWIALFWRRYAARIPRGSISHASAAGWYGKRPTLRVYRRPHGAADVILCVPAILVAEHEVTPAE